MCVYIKWIAEADVFQAIFPSCGMIDSLPYGKTLYKKFQLKRARIRPAERVQLNSTLN